MSEVYNDSLHDPGNLWRERAWRIICVLLAPALFLSIYLVHFRGPDIPTGFLSHDFAYYSANGRAVFERGNGFAGPNPFDPDPNAPAIYFHWFTWLLGLGISQFGMDPGWLFCGIGLVASVLLSWVTLRLVEAILPDPRFRLGLFLFVMWGGGLLCMARVAVNLVSGRPVFDDLFAYDPDGGWWCLNWGKNVIAPTEAVYHIIVAATWLAVVRNKPTCVLLGAALLATTHPFTGVQLLLMLNAWFGGMALIRKDRAVWITFLTLVAILTLFLGYYFVFLPSFEQHRAMQNVWTLAWILPMPSLVLAYAPIGLLAVCRVFSERFRLPNSAWFFMTCFVVSLLLAKHELFISPRQPLHFTHGYVWTPLCLIALPFLQRQLVRFRAAIRSLVFWPLLAIASGFAISDNVAFVARIWSWGKIGYTMTADQVAAFAWIRETELDGVLLCPDQKTSFLSAIYTRVRPYYGHPFNTPNYPLRVQQVSDWQRTGKEETWLENIDYILVEEHLPSPPLNPTVWKTAMEKGAYSLYVRSHRIRK